MKKLILTFFFLQSVTAWAQWGDNFNDGRFQGASDAPRVVHWTGDEAEFMIDEALRLQLYSSASASPAQLRTPSSLVSKACWEWDVEMAYAPSSSNYVKIYLASDEADLTAPLNGLFVRIGYSDRNICLMQSKKGGTNKTLISGEKGRLDIASPALSFRATLDERGRFHLYSRLSTESDFRLEGSCTVQDVPASAYFGLACFFTTTRSKHFFFDNFKVQAMDDDGPSERPDIPREGDLLFSEVMANPGAASTAYPEYIELYNATDKRFHLNDCLFYYGDRAYALPTAEMEPYGYFVLCKTTVADRFAGLPAAGVASFPTLANSGKLLMLGNIEGEIIAWFEYSDDMYGDAAKKSGGWSLECIDPDNVSNTAANWSASTDLLGGTPGASNAIRASNPDLTPPALVSTSLPDGDRVTLVFSKPMNPSLLLDPQSYSLNEPACEILHLETNLPQATELSLQFNPFPPAGQILELSLDGLRDRSGNAWADEPVLIGHGFEAREADLVINEILFNPPSDGVEYVELYNRSDKILDLRYLSITSRRPSDGSFNTAHALASLPLFLYPNEYVAVTKDRNRVCPFFDCRPESFFTEPVAMPSLANTGGCAVILNNVTGEIIDEFYYQEAMHAKTPAGKKGVALERIHPDLPTNEAGTWASATAAAGYGTPAYVNSQYSTGMTPPDGPSLSIEYPTAMENRYGIRYQLDQAGYNARAFLFDASGRLAKTILNNETLGAQGVVYWEGRGLPSGVYIVYMELFNERGDVRKLKVPVVVK